MMSVLADPLSSINKAHMDNDGAVGINRYNYGGIRKSYANGAAWKPSVFDFKSGRSGSTCPTCKGSGRIPKGQEDELVALIPYNDERLKPRRTCLYVSIVGILFLIAGGLLVAFLFPRSVNISIVSLNIYNNSGVWSMQSGKNNTDFDAILEIQTIINIKNANFFPVRVSYLNVTLLYYQDVVGLKSDEAIMVPYRASKNITIVQNATFIPPQSERIRTVCVEDHDWTEQIYLSASVYGEYSYLAQTLTFVGKKGDYVHCSDALIIVSSPTILPP